MALSENDIKKYLDQHAANFLVKQQYDNFKKLQNSANSFLKIVYNKSAEIENYEKILGKGRSGLAQVINKISAKKFQTEVTRELLKEQSLFEKELNDFLGRKIILTYVFQDGTMGWYDEIQEAKLYEKNAISDEGRGKIAHTVMQHLFSRFPKNLRAQVKESINNKKNVYSQALRRYHKQAGTGPGLMRYKEDVGTDNFYWWLNTTKTSLYYSKPIPDEGRLAQGYVNFVFNFNNNEVYPAYSSQKIDMSFENGLILLNQAINEQRNEKDKFDWIAAIVKGDIVLKSDEDIQFAVKTNDFNSPKVSSYIRFAYNISQVAYLNKDFIKQNLSKLSSGVSKGSEGAKVINKAKRQLTKQIKQEIQKNKLSTQIKPLG